MTAWGWGVAITVTFSTPNPAADETTVTVETHRQVSANVATDPQTYEDRFLDQVDSLREVPAAELRRLYAEYPAVHEAKAVDDPDELPNRGWLQVTGTAAIVSALFFFVVLLALASPTGRAANPATTEGSLEKRTTSAR